MTDELMRVLAGEMTTGQVRAAADRLREALEAEVATLRRVVEAGDALADAVNRAILDGWLANLDGTVAALATYRAETTKAEGGR